MPRFAIVVDDPDKHHAYEERAGFKPREKRSRGHVHAEMDDACPEGLPNCRNCGDPDHAEHCKANGHCPHCGVRHGIAPESVLAKHGFRLESRD